MLQDYITMKKKKTPNKKDDNPQAKPKPRNLELLYFHYYSLTCCCYVDDGYIQ